MTLTCSYECMKTRLWTPPEILREEVRQEDRERGRAGRGSQHEKGAVFHQGGQQLQGALASQKGDIYSFSIIVHEVSLPPISI